LYVRASKPVRGQLVFNIWHGIERHDNHLDFWGGCMKHTIKFESVDAMLQWLSENAVYELPVVITLDLGEKNV
jgi:hypothetical protein